MLQLIIHACVYKSACFPHEIPDYAEIDELYDVPKPPVLYIPPQKRIVSESGDKYQHEDIHTYANLERASDDKILQLLDSGDYASPLRSHIPSGRCCVFASPQLNHGSRTTPPANKPTRVNPRKQSGYTLRETAIKRQALMKIDTDAQDNLRRAIYTELNGNNCWDVPSSKPAIYAVIYNKRKARCTTELKLWLKSLSAVRHAAVHVFDDSHMVKSPDQADIKMVNNSALINKGFKDVFQKEAKIQSAECLHLLGTHDTKKYLPQEKQFKTGSSDSIYKCQRPDNPAVNQQRYYNTEQIATKRTSTTVSNEPSCSTYETLQPTDRKVKVYLYRMHNRDAEPLEEQKRDVRTNMGSFDALNSLENERRILRCNTLRNVIDSFIYRIETVTFRRNVDLAVMFVRVYGKTHLSKLVERKCNEKHLNINIKLTDYLDRYYKIMEKSVDCPSAEVGLDDSIFLKILVNIIGADEIKAYIASYEQRNTLSELHSLKKFMNTFPCII